MDRPEVSLGDEEEAIVERKEKGTLKLSKIKRQPPHYHRHIMTIPLPVLYSKISHAERLENLVFVVPCGVHVLLYVFLVVRLTV